MIRVESIVKSYPESREPALRGVSFEAERGSVYTLLGPSGCGKTTSLRCVAGLERPETGRITLGEKMVFSSADRINFAPDRRNIGMVFQSYAIWPHMTVGENVAYPLGGKRLGREAIRTRMARALDLVGLGDLADRPAPNLSGGQQQRVALARAIVGEPEILLLDEPLSNLDAKLREQMRRELAALQKRLGITMLYVTHDQEEAMALSHRIALLRDGSIVEEGDPLSMYHQPRHPFTAAFLGSANFVPCRLNGRPADGERIEVETAFGRFAAIARRGEEREPKLFFRPNIARPEARSQSPGLGQGVGTVMETTFLGESVDFFLRNGAETIRLRLHNAAAPAVGEDIAFSLGAEDAIAFVAELAGS